MSHHRLYGISTIRCHGSPRDTIDISPSTPDTVCILTVATWNSVASFPPMETRGASHERERISMAVVEAVAESSGTDPLDLTPPLSSVIDADALDRLYRQGADVEVQFEYNGHAV